MPYVIPDVLTGLRVLCAAGLLIALIGENWTLALALLLVGIVSDAIDGEIVRRFRMPETDYGEGFDQVADAALWGALFIGLWWSDKLPLVFLVVIMLGGFFLQATTGIEKSSRWWWVRRHAHYIHPFSYAITLGGGVVWLTKLAAEQRGIIMTLCAIYGLTAAVIWHSKQKRINQFLQGP